MENQITYIELSEKCGNLPHIMRLEKEAQHKTNQQVADETGLPVYTVNKFFAGSLSNLGIYTVAPIAVALGLSLDQLLGITQAPPESDAKRLEEELAHKDQLLQKTEEQVALLQERSRMMEREINAVRANWKPVVYGLTGLCILLAVYLLTYVTLDARNPNLGLIQAARSSPLVYVAGLSIVSMCLYIGHLFTKRKNQKKDGVHKNGEQ